LILHKLTKTNTILTLILIFILGGCSASTDKIGSDRVHSDDIHQSYDIYYDANTNTTDIYATFRVGGSTGTTVELVKPGKLEMNDQDAILDNKYGAHYSLKLRSGNQQTINIIWTTNEGTQYKNNFNILPAAISTNFNNIISLHSNVIIDVEAANFDREKDTISLDVHQVRSDGMTNENNIGTYDSITKQIIVKSENLQNLQPGPVIFTLSRSSFRTLDQKTSKGGNAYLKYNKEFSGQVEP